MVQRFAPWSSTGLCGYCVRSRSLPWLVTRRSPFPLLSASTFLSGGLPVLALPGGRILGGGVAVTSVSCGVSPVGGLGALAEGSAFVSTGVADAGVVEDSPGADVAGVDVVRFLCRSDTDPSRVRDGPGWVPPPGSFLLGYAGGGWTDSLHEKPSGFNGSPASLKRPRSFD